MIADKQQFDIDTQWKELIGELFEEWISFFIPKLVSLIDFSKAPEFLDKEFAKIVPEYYKGGQKFNDKLVKVYLKSGEEQFLLIHIEVQAQPDKDFAERMFISFYRLYDRYGKNIDATAIYTDAGKTYCPDDFRYEKFETELIYKFRTYKTAIQEEEELLKKQNPFALAVLATQYMHKSKKETDSQKRLTFKRKLIRLLFERGYSKEKIGKLLLFIANILALPKELEVEYRKELVNELKKHEDMPLTFENSVFAESYKYEWLKEGIEQGIERGIEQGIEQGIERGVLKEKFIVSLNMMQKQYTNEQIIDVTNLSLQQVEALRKKYMELGDAVYDWIAKQFEKKANNQKKTGEEIPTNK